MRTGLAILAICFADVIVSAQDFSSTNALSLGSFWHAVEQGEGPVTVVAFGDSVQADYRSVATYLFPMLQGKLGWAGTVFLDPWNPNKESGGSIVSYGPNTNWWHVQEALCPAAYKFWKNYADPTGSTRADNAGIYFIATPQGGSFQISLSTNGGPWFSTQTVNAFSPVPEGRYTSLILQSNGYRIRVDSLAGTNLILGCQLSLSTSRGTRFAFLQRDGLNLGEFFNVPDRILSPIVSNLQPDLIIWHMKELGDGGQDVFTLSNRLEQLEELWQKGAPDADVIYIGTPYAFGADTNSSRTLIQNELVRQIAVTHGRCYIDGMTPMVSYQYMVTNGYLLDDVHPSLKYYQWLASAIWNQTLFTLLRENRALAISATENGIIITCPRFANTTHQFLSSTNLADWSVIDTAGPSSQPWQATNPPGNFFRFQYLPAD